ncbi:MAG: exosortase C-terminal domain/associated protein EpsI [Candidatus Sulfotelmatobacter sp.]
MKRSGILRFIFAAALIGLTAILLQARGRTEVVPARLPLSSFPEELANWSSNEIVQDKKTLEVLGPGDFMERVYQDPAGKLPAVDLFIAYFPSQRAGDTIHSPQHCLPGAGWNPEENVRVSLSVPGHAPFPANRYVIAKGDDRRLVLYWFWAHDRGVASEYWAKYYLVKDAIRMNRSDGSLVRLVTPLYPGETAEQAQRRIYPFTSAVVPLLDDYIPK